MPRTGTPSGMAEVRESSPIIVAVATVVFFFGRVDGSAVSLHFVGLLATSAVPEVIISEILTTAKHKSRVI